MSKELLDELETVSALSIEEERVKAESSVWFDRRATSRIKKIPYVASEDTAAVLAKAILADRQFVSQAAFNVNRGARLDVVNGLLMAVLRWGRPLGIEEGVLHDLSYRLHTSGLAEWYQAVLSHRCPTCSLVWTG